MMLEVTREPDFKVELMWALAYKMYYLSVSQSAGYDFMMKLYEISSEAHKKGDAIGDFWNAEILADKRKQEEEVAEVVRKWERATAAFIGLHVGERQKTSFLNCYPSIDMGLQGARRLRLPILPGQEKAKEGFTPSHWTLIDSIDARVKNLDAFRKALR